MLPIATAHLPGWGQILQPSLDHQTIRLGGEQQRDLFALVVFLAGQARFDGDQGSEQLHRPGLLLRPPGPVGRLRLEAGSHAVLIFLSEDFLREAVGTSTGPEQLRTLLRHATAVELPLTEQVASCAFLAGRLVAEMAEMGPGGRLAALSYVRLLLIEIMRGAGDPSSEPDAPAGTILQRFRQLVEARFRDHLPITRYAAELNITPDRLHDLCRRALGKPPLQLLHERLLREALLRLERSRQPIQQIAEQLGFSDATHFSHFFKRHCGMPPLLYRRRLKSPDQPRAEPRSRGFADWP